MINNCSSCGCSSCRNDHNSRRRGALRQLGCDSCRRCENALTCAGYPLYYNGPCPCANTCCSGYCHDDCNCNNHCNNHCHCGGEAVPWMSRPCAAEFAAYAPQNCASGGALNFRMLSCHGNSFSECSGGLRAEIPGLYMLTYTFSAPSGMNAASELCLHCGGRALPASAAHIAPVTCANSRTAMGHALVELCAGEVVSLNTSTAMDICGGCMAPVATIIAVRVG